MIHFMVHVASSVWLAQFCVSWDADVTENRNQMTILLIKNRKDSHDSWISWARELSTYIGRYSGLQPCLCNLIWLVIAQNIRFLILLFIKSCWPWKHFHFRKIFSSLQAFIKSLTLFGKSSTFMLQHLCFHPSTMLLFLSCASSTPSKSTLDVLLALTNLFCNMIFHPIQMLQCF